MKSHKFNIFNLLIYFLIIILFLIICLNFYKILKSSSEININVSSRKNKILKDTNNISEIYYNENSIDKIPNISKADIVYQWFDKSINSLSYSSIIYNKNITDSSSISFKNSVNVSELPTIEFIDLITLNENNFLEGRKNITFKFPNKENIQFCFKNDMYYYYEINNNSSIEISPVCFTNIVVIRISDYYNDYVFNNKSKIIGEGFVFSNGKYKEVMFKDNLIFDPILNSQVPLLKGTTFWCFLNSDSQIEFSN